MRSGCGGGSGCWGRIGSIEPGGRPAGRSVTPPGTSDILLDRAEVAEW